MTASPYCAACWARKQRPRARDACNTPHVRERNRRTWLERHRRQRDKLMAEEAAKFRARTMSAG